MGRLLLLLALADIVIMVVALIDCLSVEERTVRTLPRIVWALIILLFSPAGGIAWFVAGRQRGSAGGGERQPGGDADEPTVPIGPDDDTAFLTQISTTSQMPGAPQQPATAAPATTQQEDVELLRAWEADLRRREEKLREQERATAAGRGEADAGSTDAGGAAAPGPKSKRRGLRRRRTGGDEATPES